MPLDKHIRIVAGFKLARDLQKTHGLVNNYLWLRPSVTASKINQKIFLSLLGIRQARNLSFGQIRAILSNADLLYRILVNRFGFRPLYWYGDLYLMTEQLPNHNSRVRLSDSSRDRFGYPVASVDWQLTSADFRNFEAYARIICDQGLCSDGYSLAYVDGMENWAQNVTSAAHHMGTARMADHPSRGVVDQNLNVFGIKNLFICDASVFSDAGSVNPSLTLVALALRLSEHLSK